MRDIRYIRKLGLVGLLQLSRLLRLGLLGLLGVPDAYFLPQVIVSPTYKTQLRETHSMQNVALCVRAYVRTYVCMRACVCVYACLCTCELPSRFLHTY